MMNSWRGAQPSAAHQVARLEREVVLHDHGRGNLGLAQRPLQEGSVEVANAHGQHDGFLVQPLQRTPALAP
jgi:hypothetical protein